MNSLRGKFIPKFSSLYGFMCRMAFIFIIFITNEGYSQSVNIDFARVAAKDSASNISRGDRVKAGRDSLTVRDSLATNDSILLKNDSTAAKADTSKKRRLEKSLGIKISKDELQSVIKAEAADSAVMDMEHSVFFLFRKAKVNYEDMELDAGQVTYRQSNSNVMASPYIWEKDTGFLKQTFTQGKEKFTYDSMQYNFKSKRAIVRNVHSQYGEGYMFSEQIKRNPDQTVYGLYSTYTTCALDTPHFGIVAKKIKVIPGKVIITGPANLYIEGVPTPFWLPFGIFPQTDKQKSGFILPTYTIEEARGLGLLNGGYYNYINDHVDLLTQANLYTKGSYAVSALTNYRDMYHYSGTFNFSYAYNKTGEDFEPGATVQKDFMVNWTHQSDPKSVPGQSFNASVEAGTSTFYSNNSYDPNQILQNQRQSNITYSKNWQDKPFSLTISALANQNSTTKQTNVTLPDINFHVAQINPFQKKTRIGSHWYDKITLSYSVEALNRTTFYDTTFSFKDLTYNNMSLGVHHSIPVSASYTILRFVNMSFSINYDEYWVNEKLYQHYDSSQQKIDSSAYYGLYASRDFSAGVTFSTRIYGLKRFKNAKIGGIRHVLTPSVGLTFHPDFGAAPFNYYYRTTLDSTNNYKNYQYVSPYVTSIVGTPPLGKAGAVNFGISNNLQIKVRSSKDTVTGYKNVTLIDNFSITTSYNPAVDSFQWSPIAMSFHTNLLDKINISSSANFDPYAIDYNTGRRLPETMEDEGFGLARFSNATVSVGSNFHSKPIGGGADPTNSQEYSRILHSAGYKDYVDFNVPWSFNFSYSYSINNNYSPYSKRDTLVNTQTLTLQGEVNLTKRWKLNVSSGFNFNYDQLTLTSIDLYRDLHCWAMHLQTVPFGPRKSFTFTLNVKSSVLQDLKLVRRRDYRDTPE